MRVELIIPVTDVKVSQMANRIPGNKAPGPDGIPGKAAKTRPAHLTRVFNQCLEEGKFPTA